VHKVITLDNGAIVIEPNTIFGLHRPTYKTIPPQRARIPDIGSPNAFRFFE